jgi:phosphatidylglycerol---prolipoprotein diacylglyceryl transferase
MCPVLLHIYGPFSINAYGTAIAIGFLLALFLARKDPRKGAIITDDQALTLLSGSIIAGIFGARFFYFIIEAPTFTWYDFFAFWQGGGTELGSILAIIIFAGSYIYAYKIPPLTLLDIAGNYAPLLQGFARIGCFFAGCCHGLPSTSSWAIMYTDPRTLAPLYVPLFPIQLVMSAFFFLLFFLLLYAKSLFSKPGQIFFLYIIGASIIRIGIDFFRGDVVHLSLFSTYQWISFFLFCCALIGLLITLRHKS